MAQVHRAMGSWQPDRQRSLVSSLTGAAMWPFARSAIRFLHTSHERVILSEVIHNLIVNHAVEGNCGCHSRRRNHLPSRTIVISTEAMGGFTVHREVERARRFFSQNVVSGYTLH